MNEYKHTPFDEEILDAMITYNADKPSSEKFTLIDARIISLIHSFSYTGTTCFASNQYLAEKCLTTTVTVQKSINRLLNHNLIDKKISSHEGKRQRILTYNETAADQFKTSVQEIQSKVI